jgi:hypothetical protein
MTMDAGERTYTVEEADAMLPELRELLGRVRTNRQTMLGAAERITGAVEADGGGHFGTDYWEASRALRADVERLARDDIVLRDPETGLIDFPGEREGRPVFLCWRLGEDRVGFWHDVRSGFLGRQPI